MNSIKAVHSEAIVGNEEYHILVSYCHCTVLLYLIKDGTQSFIVLLVCKRIDHNTFCIPVNLWELLGGEISPLPTLFLRGDFVRRL